MSYKLGSSSWSFTAMADKAVGGGSRQKKNRKRWVIVFACFLANFTCGMIVLALPFLYQELLKRFGQSAAVTSGPFSFFKGLGYFLCKFGILNFVFCHFSVIRTWLRYDHRRVLVRNVRSAELVFRRNVLFSDVFTLIVGPALTAVWSKAPPLTVRCLSPLPGFESRPGHVRKLPVTWS